MNRAPEDIFIKNDDSSDDTLLLFSSRHTPTTPDLNGIFAVARAHLRWLADELGHACKARTYRSPASTTHGDTLFVYGGGTEHLPLVNLANYRTAAPFVGIYALALTRPLAEKLRTLLLGL